VNRGDAKQESGEEPAQPPAADEPDRGTTTMISTFAFVKLALTMANL
jgi:hypothetical protein